jgi:hypothetical protein
MSKQHVKIWEISGGVGMVLAGSALHFVFAWTGYWRPIAWLAPVNESVWEHFKLAFWPGLLFALVEYGALRTKTNNFWLAKFVSLAAMPMIIGCGFYSYTAMLGHNLFGIDISLFLIAVVLGQWLSYRVLIAAPQRKFLQQLALAGLVVLALDFAAFSYAPPHIFLFRDSRTQEYGMHTAEDMSHE